MELHNCALEHGWVVLLRDRRLALGLSQQDLAWKIGVSATAICHWETGISGPQSFAKWNLWAHACGLPDIIPHPPQYKPEDDDAPE